MKDQYSLKRTFSVNMLFILLATIGLWCAIWIHGQYAAFKSESKILRQDYIESQKNRIKNEVLNAIDYIAYMKNQTESRLKTSMAQRVYEAHDIALNLYLENNLTQPRDLIKKMIKDALRPIRFNQGRGYFFAFNLNGVEELFSDHPEMEGKNMLSVHGANNESVVKDMIDIVRVQGEGFYRYTWTKPNETQKNFPKIAFVKQFEPLNWAIGTGEYLDDVKHQIQDEVLNRLVEMRFGKDGYFFGSTFSGEPLFSNGHITKGTKSIWDLTDPDGVKIIQEQRKAALQPEGGYVSYRWNKMGGQVPIPKISFVTRIPQWDWVIGAGVYLDNIETTIAQKKSLLKSSLITTITQSIIISITLLGLIFFWVKYISSKIETSIKGISVFFEKAAGKSIPSPPSPLHFQELVHIANSAQKMIVRLKQTQADLRDSEQRFRAITETAQDSIFCKDSDRKYTFVNQAMANLFGCHPNDLIGKTAEDIFDTKNAAVIRKVDNRSFEGERVSEIRSLWIREQKFVFQTIQVPMIMEDNKVIGISGIVRDITDIIKTQEDKERLEAQLRHAHKMEAIGTLAGGIAHDFNNILGIIIGNAEIAANDIPPDNPANECLVEIVNASFRARDIVKRILGFSRSIDGKAIPIDINHTILESFKLLRATIPSNIKFKHQFLIQNARVLGDPSQIHQILVNLCTNAAFAMRNKGGTLEITTRLTQNDAKDTDALTQTDITHDKSIEIQVIDTGHGIPADIIDRIFDPYFTTREFGKGSGMGLSVVHGIVSTMGGRISVKSNIDKGTQFTILLPLLDSASVSDNLNQEMVLSGNENILLVDDESSLLKTTAKSLRRYGYRVKTFTDPIKALSDFQTTTLKYDLLITDMTMPELTGVELVRQIFALAHDLPVIMCTGYNESIDETKARELGISSFLVKPVDHLQLAKTVRMVLDRTL